MSLFDGLIGVTFGAEHGLPLDGFAINRHFILYFAGLKAIVYTKWTKKLLKVFLNK